MQSVYVLALGCIWAAAPLAGQTGPDEFDAQAFHALPVEQPYAFHRALERGAPRVERDAAARPDAVEMALPADGWSLVIPANAGAALRQAAEDLREYLDTSMRTRVRLAPRASLAGWQTIDRAIVAGTREQMPGCGAALATRKDYRITVSENRIAVCGFDERGAMYGIYNLEARMDLRQAPFFPRNLDTVRHSLFQARMTLSGLGWMEWPDQYLALLPRYGFDSIYASVYVNPNGAPGPPPYWDKMKKQDPARVHDLIRRAARYGIELYCPIVYLYTGEPENEAGLRKLVRDLVREFPEIRGYVLLTEGFFYRNWFGAGGQGKTDLRDWVSHWAQGVAIVTEECRKANPAIEVLPWEYNIDFRPNQVELKAFGTEQLPPYSIPLLTFENGKAFERDGERGSLKDYAINETGPAEVTVAQIAAARRHGMRAVYSKADCWASWQYGTFPYLPFPYQWYARYEALEKYGVNGTMESWSYGFQPNYIAEMRAWYSWSDAPQLNSLLRLIARREFGAGAEEHVLKAWRRFSDAIRLVPDTGPNMGVNNAVATPMFFEKPRPRAMTVEHSWTDPDMWSRDSEITPYWPYTPQRLILLPDFTNRVNAAQQYASPFSLPVFNKYLGLAAEEMEKGLESYRSAALGAPAAKQRGAFREVLLAGQLARMMRSDAAVLEFEDLRFKLAHTPDSAQVKAILDRMTVLVREELKRTEASYETARRDSRLGYEWEQDYIYTPDHIQEKLKLLRVTLDEQIPAYRKSH
jgi:hypothetical protein